jgi:hypothetical protein
MAAASTVLRFVTVRNPRKATEDDLAQNFVFYDDDAIAAPLVRAARKAWPEGRRAVYDKIRKFTGTNQYIKTTKQLHEVAKNLVDWGEWMIGHAGTISVESMRHRLDHDPPQAGIEVERLLWDNLLAQTFVGGVPEVREGIISALRAANLTHVDNALLHHEESGNALANATVVVPRLSEDEPDFELRAEPEDPEGGGKQPKRKPAEEHRLAEVTKLQSAHAELLGEFRQEVQSARLEEAPAPPVPRARRDGTCVEYPEDDAGAENVRVGLIGADAKRRLSKDTRTALEALGFKADQDHAVPDMLVAIERSAQQKGAEASFAPSMSRSVVQVGGAFWMSGGPTGEEEVRGPRMGPYRIGARRDIEYHDFYPLPQPSEGDEKPVCSVKPLGVADYRRVEQEIACYEPGEVAHIENVLKGETKQRVTRRLSRNEQITTFATEEEKTDERDTQTTDRFQIEKEAEKTVQEDIKFDLGVNVQASYGVVKLTADTKFAYAHSTKESDKVASTYAKEVVDRALERVTKKVRQEQITKTLEEFEETNTHGLEAKEDHTVGLYRWVNKVYEAKVVNYGKRLMFQFTIPEPGAFHLFASMKDPIEGTLAVEKPVDPRSNDVTSAYGVPGPLKEPSYLNATNYAMWASFYGAKVDPAPEYKVTISKAFNRDSMDDTAEFSDSKNDLKLPDGYEASQMWSSYGMHSASHDGPNWITVIIGRWSKFTTSGGSFNHWLDGEDDFVPFVIMGRTRFYAVNVEVECVRKEGHLEEWQNKTFEAIINAYNDRMAAYENALAEAKSKAGVEIQGSNPARNREVEAMELKKSAIRLMTQCRPLGSEAMKDADPQDQCSTPEFDCCEAIEDGSYVQYVEQAFEWSLMTYLFYPYFWGRHCKWRKIYQLQDADPIFLNFLQAGFARVLVPVRLGYEDSALRFVADGIPWNGGSVPGVDSEMYLAIANEMKEPVGTVDPDVAPWDVVVPTELTVLQCESGCVEGHGLPCPRSESEDEEPDDDH